MRRRERQATKPTASQVAGDETSDEGAAIVNSQGLLFATLVDDDSASHAEIAEPLPGAGA